MNGNQYLQQHIKTLGVSTSEIARLTGLSQSLVSMHLTSQRGIGGRAAMAYHKSLNLSLSKLLSKKEA